MQAQSPHGEAGHLNVVVRDQESVVTGYGQHARVVAFAPEANEFYARVDMVWGLPCPTEEQILTAARKDQRLRGRWRMVGKCEYVNNGVTHYDCRFKRIRA